MRGLRNCPICPSCGSRKFRVIINAGMKALVECRKCSKRLTI